MQFDALFSEPLSDDQISMIGGQLRQTMEDDGDSMVIDGVRVNVLDMTYMNGNERCKYIYFVISFKKRLQICLAYNGISA